MTTIESTTRLALFLPDRCDPAQRPAGGVRFDLAVALLTAWMLAGTILDGFAHHNLPDTIETFFTPWHGVLYSGFLAAAGFLGFHWVRNVLRGYAWYRAAPIGYTLSLAGIPLFGLAGFGDMLWHTLFGFETGAEIIFSPTHLLLAVGGTLLIVGPLRAAWHRVEAQRGWRSLLPATTALLTLLSTFTFFTEYANVLMSPELVAEGAYDPHTYAVFHHLIHGIAGVLIPSALIVGVLLHGLRRWELPSGSVVFLIAGNGLLMAVFHYGEVSRYPQPLLVTLLAGLIGEGLYRWLRPSAERVAQLRLFAFLLPVVLFGLFFGVMLVTAHVWWTVHIWTGVTFLAGVTGLLLSYLVAAK